MGLYSSEKERNLKFLGYFKLSTRADVTVSSVEFLLVIMDEPYDERCVVLYCIGANFARLYFHEFHE